jgi:hypothetical protein
MRNTFAEALYKAATTNPDVYIVVADISPASAAEAVQHPVSGAHQCGRR